MMQHENIKESIDGMILSKWFLNKYVIRMRAGFIWCRTESSEWLL
jgi:hypothetical protein